MASSPSSREAFSREFNDAGEEGIGNEKREKFLFRNEMLVSNPQVASSHSSLAPTVEIGGIWPLKGIGVLDPREIPFLNTPIPPSSRAAVTWAHHAILARKEKRAVYALVATVSLALISTGFQGMEGRNTGTEGRRNHLPTSDSHAEKARGT
ncbi:cytochrome c oxidase subunit 3-like [Magnolia sinica]|uniref:cytochrome c oxidase subunit 3-like n=1 Tax=Magnolia sinica TaxID=86752 RepID=UPI0026597376|nr:cytochrome c oxidase subunit 3-like [Magnolia sinica]